MIHKKLWHLFGWFSVVLNYLSMIHEKLWNLFGMILNDSQWFVKNSWNLFGLILSNSLWFLVTRKKLWNLFQLILDDCQWFAKNSEIYLGQFSVILGDWQKLWNLFGWISVIPNDCQWFTKNWNLFGLILSNSQWIYLSVIHEKLWDLFGMTLQWFSMICENFWNLFVAILNDSWWLAKTLKFIWGESQWCLMILDDSQKLWNLFWAILNLFRVILDDFWWFSMIHKHFEIYLG